MDRRTDNNAPEMVLVPRWGPDLQSLRTAIRNFLFASTFSPANIGPGVRPAPNGASASERTKSTTWFAPQQNFRGFVAKTTDPTLKNVKTTASLPSANAQINPVLMAMSQTQLDPNGSWM